MLLKMMNWTCVWMIKLGGRKNEVNGTSSESIAVIKGQVFVLFCLLLSRGLEYSDRHSGKENTRRTYL